jgi:NADH:ubiquinone oxidoreductase subunit 2 (subunit N)
MYLSDKLAGERGSLALSPTLRATLLISLIGIIFIGIYPQPLIDLAQKLFVLK